MLYQPSQDKDDLRRSLPEERQRYSPKREKLRSDFDQLDDDNRIESPAAGEAHEFASWEWLVRKMKTIYQPPTYSRRTRQKMVTAVRYFQRHASHPSMIEEETMADFIAAAQVRGLSGKPLCKESINSVTRSMQSVCEYLVKKKIIEFSPFQVSDWLFPVIDKRSRKFAHLSVAEARLLLKQADREWEEAKGVVPKFRAARTRALAWLLTHTGVRAEEALYLKLVDYDGAFIKIYPNHHLDERLKTRGSRRIVGVPRDAAKRIDEWVMLLHEAGHEWMFPGQEADNPWLNGNPTSRACGKMIALGERAGVKTKCTLQSLRRTLNTHMRTRWGFNKDEAMLIVGHSSEQTQEWYTIDDMENMRLLAKRINYFDET